MFVVLLHYTASDADIEARMVDHYDWLTRHYDAGDFIAAGNRQPRTGSVIITRAMSRGKLDAILASDPFAVDRLVRHEVIEFHALRTIPELANYADPLTAADERPRG
ncbi:MULTISPECIES: YciI family protein [Saccharopolyspora]|uniref:YciI family protein n=1 Tax=Saccharopolyspora cebuensis TaxID=418759 RepID=A0ABV4CL20_9PSEU